MTGDVERFYIEAIRFLAGGGRPSRRVFGGRAGAAARVWQPHCLRADISAERF